MNQLNCKGKLWNQESLLVFAEWKLSATIANSSFLDTSYSPKTFRIYIN